MVKCYAHDSTIGKIFDKIDDFKDDTSERFDNVKDAIHDLDKSIAVYQSATETKLDLIAASVSKRSYVIPALNNLNWTRIAKGIGLIIGAVGAAIGSYYAATASQQVAISPPAQHQQLERDTDTAVRTVWNDGDEREVYGDERKKANK